MNQLFLFKISIEGNGLCTSVYYKPTDSHSYLLYSSSHPSHVKNSIPFSQFVRLRRLCSDDSDLFPKVNVSVFRKAWLPCLYRSSGSTPRATYWSAVITTNVTKRTFRPHSIHMHKPLPSIETLMFKKDKESSEFSQVYFRAGWKELTAVMNCVSSSLVEEVAPIQSSM